MLLREYSVGTSNSRMKMLRARAPVARLSEAINLERQLGGEAGRAARLAAEGAFSFRSPISAELLLRGLRGSCLGLFSHGGLCALIFLYLIVGALLFPLFESSNENVMRDYFLQEKAKIAKQIVKEMFDVVYASSYPSIYT